MNSCKHLAAAAALALGGGLASLPAHAAATFFFTDTPYLSAADIPAGFYAGGAPVLLDNFEDGSLDASLSGSLGDVIGPGVFDGLRDSVDGDDGAIDGKGLAGSTWFTGPGSLGVAFTFNGAVLPTAFAVVWTDGAGAVTFGARDGAGNLLGTITRGGFLDGSTDGTTAEDRFFGVTFAGGIKTIFISNSLGGIEVDHVQYGAMVAPAPVPLAATGWLMLSAAAVLAARRRSA